MLIGTTERNGREIEYVYDDAGRRTQEKWLDGLGSPIHTIAYECDDPA